MKINLNLFFTGLLQVIFVSLNTFQIAMFVKKQEPLLLCSIIIIGFVISIIWTFNVKKIAFGNILDRISYASGAGIGSAIGVTVGFLLY